MVFVFTNHLTSFSTAWISGQHYRSTCPRSFYFSDLDNGPRPRSKLHSCWALLSVHFSISIYLSVFTHDQQRASGHKKSRSYKLPRERLTPPIFASNRDLIISLSSIHFTTKIFGLICLSWNQFTCAPSFEYVYISTMLGSTDCSTPYGCNELFCQYRQTMFTLGTGRFWPMLSLFLEHSGLKEEATIQGPRNSELPTHIISKLQTLSTWELRLIYISYRMMASE